MLLAFVAFLFLFALLDTFALLWADGEGSGRRAGYITLFDTCILNVSAQGRENIVLCFQVCDVLQPLTELVILLSLFSLV